MLRRLWPVGVFVWLFGLWGYSGDLSFRQQTDAFLRGSLALQPLPHGQHYDWAWGNGSQQPWGLGIPLLRLPFEAVTRLFGGFGFPDVLVFVLWFAAAAWLVSGALRRRAFAEEAALGAVTVLSPAFINLCRTRFECYEESIGAAYLVSLILGALLLRLVAEPRPRLLLLLGALAGLGPLFRPTVLFYSVAALALGLWAGRRLPRRALVAAAGLFGIGMLLQLGINQLRFGSPFELGHRLNVSYDPIDQFGKIFGHPYAHESIGRAAAELLSALFQSKTANDYYFYRDGLLPWQSPTLRFREFYFATFAPWTAAALAAGWIVAVVFRRRLDTATKTAALFSFLAFAGEAAFYLRAPSFTSRYAVDFAAAVAFGLVALLLAAFTLTRRPLIISAAAIGLTVWGIAGAWFGEVQSHRLVLSAAEARDKMPHPKFAAVPDHYQCGWPAEALTGIPLNGLRWTRDCRVQTVTVLYLGSKECYQLRTRGDGEVRVKRGLTELSLISDERDGSDRLLGFCSPAPRNPTGVEVVFIGWGLFGTRQLLEIQ